MGGYVRFVYTSFMEHRGTKTQSFCFLLYLARVRMVYFHIACLCTDILEGVEPRKPNSF